MKSMWDSVRMQLFYQWKAKYVMTLLLFLVVLCGFSSYAQYSSLHQKEVRFNDTMQMYEKDGITLKQALSEDLEITKDGNSEEISNVLKYDYYRVIAAKVALNPLNAPNQIFTSIAILFLPIVFGIYSCHVAFFDFKHRTMKSQLLLKGYRSLFFSKLLSIAVVAVVSVLATILISIGIQYAFNLVMGIQPNISVNYLSELPMQFVYQSVVLILFGSFFFLLTVAVRSTLVSIIALFVYMLLVPNLGGFDVKNLMLLTVPKIYNTSASTMDVISGENANLMLGYLVVFAVFAVLIFVVYKWDKKRLCSRL
ncbi:ABC transporter permease [Listeria sp. FSL L7-1582]|uniref:ABC transporter permease subunit n=1 Tax=Listeria portnoyi TaxID=2713504 RepID=UPI00164E4A5C|nr:ABC transporter permease subunit [Listeria portnoyi]MBC6308627.1 ABC transporter permease [Listeria portnoyi]